MAFTTQQKQHIITGMNSDTHVFACFSAAVDGLPIGQNTRALLSITRKQDEVLLHRLYRVIKVCPKEKVILFGKKYILTVIMEEASNNGITFVVINQQPIQPLEPIINLWVPLLEKSALEQAIYSATILGVHTIYLIPTTKNTRHPLTLTEQERVTRIMIAAAEQSKQFFIPTLHIISNWNALPTPSQPIFADIEGVSFNQCVNKINRKTPCTLIIGPAGDFTTEEKEKLHSFGVIKGKLVPSVLRSEDAVIVSLGIMRNILNT
jgi:16S rRNA (uracil1498-N3)-methyltransferase